MRLPAFGFILILLAGCASLATPQSFDQRVAYGFASVTAVRQTATDLLNRDRITVEQAQYVQTKADEARGYLELARGAVDPREAQDKLSLALTILTALEASLKASE